MNLHKTAELLAELIEHGKHTGTLPASALKNLQAMLEIVSRKIEKLNNIKN